MNVIKEVHIFANDYVNVKTFRTSLRKAKIREAYTLVTGKKLKLSCSTCYIEALLEIINKVKMATKKGYELKKGVLLQAFGDASKTCTDATLTDSLAEWYLDKYPEKAILFSKIPSDAPFFRGKTIKSIIPPGITIIPPVKKENIIPDGTPDVFSDTINKTSDIENKENKPEVKKVVKKKTSKPKV